MTKLEDRALLDRFRDAVAQRFGLSFDEDRRPFLLDVLAKQIGWAGSTEPHAYVHRLATGTASGDELTKLAEDLTVGETYFFRHSDQLRVHGCGALPPRHRP